MTLGVGSGWVPVLFLEFGQRKGTKVFCKSLVGPFERNERGFRTITHIIWKNVIETYTHRSSQSCRFKTHVQIGRRSFDWRVFSPYFVTDPFFSVRIVMIYFLFSSNPGLLCRPRYSLLRVLGPQWVILGVEESDRKGTASFWEGRSVAMFSVASLGKRCLVVVVSYPPFSWPPTDRKEPLKKRLCLVLDETFASQAFNIFKWSTISPVSYSSPLFLYFFPNTSEPVSLSRFYCGRSTSLILFPSLMDLSYTQTPHL